MTVCNRFDRWNLILGILVIVVMRTPLAAQAPVESPLNGSDGTQSEQLARWTHWTSMAVPPLSSMPEPLRGDADLGGRLVDAILGPDVFTKARPDLSDLRLLDASDQAIPFALRTLRAQKQQQAVPANEFNRDEPDAGVHQLTLDLLQSDIQHNEIQIVTTGDNFRRPVEIDGSDDGTNWRRLVSGSLIRFAEDDQKINIERLHYSDSRYRFVRVRVGLDPNTTNDDAPDRFSFQEVSVMREIDFPGERLTLEATLGPRQGMRSVGAPSSAWIIDLGGENIPCDQIIVDVADNQFVRDIELQAELPYGPLGQKSFSTIYGSYGSSTWQRKPGEVHVPMIATFNEIQTSRLRLQVADYRNAPLSIRSVRFSAPARQLVFDHPSTANTEVHLYVGNPDAESPHYDFARNLPDELKPAPVRVDWKPLAANPNFVPPPKAFLERFPWLIYAVLAAVIAALAIVITNLARTAIILHDTGSISPTSHTAATTN